MPLKNGNIEKAYRVALIALKKDISEIENQFGVKEANRVEKEDWGGKNPAFMSKNDRVPNKSRIIKYGKDSSDFFLHPMPGFHPTACKSYEESWGNNQKMINDFSFAAFDIGALLFDIATIPSGEGPAYIVGRKAFLKYISTASIKFTKDATQQFIATGFKTEEIDWADSYISGVIKYKVGQRVLKAFFDFRDGELVIKPFNDARDDYRVRIITGKTLEKLIGDKKGATEYFAKTTEKVVRGQINKAIHETTKE